MKKRNGDYSCKACRYFSKLRLKFFGVAAIPHKSFDEFPYPIFVGNPRFIKMAAKDKVRNYLNFKDKFLFVYMRQRVKKENRACAQIVVIALNKSTFNIERIDLYAYS